MTKTSDAAVSVSWTMLAATLGTPHAGRIVDQMADLHAAKLAILRGEIAPLNEIMHSLRYLGDGRLVDVELVQEEDAWRYHMAFITMDGRLRRLVISAASTEIEQDEVE